MEELLTVQNLFSLLTLSALEIVLGIDNVIFISILAGKLPVEKQATARNLGLGLALIARIILLFGITWLIGLKDPFVTILDHSFTGKDLILLAGGIFLMGKSVSEIHEKLEGEHTETINSKTTALWTVLLQIVLIDIVFSFDSILTAVGLVQHIEIMIAAVIISIAVMFIFAKSISNFVNEHPTIKVLALSFLILIGFMLTLEGFHYEIPKGYIYFAMAFSLIVELINMRVRKKGQPVKLKPFNPKIGK